MEATPRNRRDKQGEHGNLYLIVPQGRLHSEKDWLSPETNPGWGPQGHPGFQPENTQDWAHWSSWLRSITARGCEAEPAMGEGPVGEGWGPGETGPSFHRQIVSHTFDRSPPGSSGRGSSQAGILAWVAISFSRGSSRLRDRTHISCIGRRILYH